MEIEKYEDEELHEFRDRCRQTGLKLTAPRLAVYRFLRGNREHPGVDRVWEEVRKELPTISRESVYRVLNDFVSHKIIALLDRPDVVARYDADTSRHDHFYCRQCGRYFDFKIDELPKLVEAAIGSFGKIERYEIRARGVCKECLAKNQSAPIDEK